MSHLLLPGEDRTGSSLFGQMCQLRRFILPPDTPVLRTPAQLRAQALGSTSKAKLFLGKPKNGQASSGLYSSVASSDFSLFVQMEAL